MINIDSKVEYIIYALCRIYSGGTVAPLFLDDKDSQPLFENILVIIPAICAFIVFFLVAGVAIFVFFCRNRIDDNQSEACMNRGYSIM